MRRSRLIETKLRDSLEFFNDHPNYGLRRDRRRTTYQLAAEIDAALATPTFWQRLQRLQGPLIGSVIGTGLLIFLLDVLPGGGS
jgi:hypothetical protein